MKDSIYKNKRYILLSVIVLVIAWHIIAKLINKEIIVPEPISVLKSLIEIIREKNFKRVLLSSLSRSCISFLISVLTALILGILSGLIKPFYNLMKPVVAILKAVPTMAIVILALIWLESEKAPILIGVILVFPVLYHSVVEGMHSVDIKLLQMAKLYSVSKKYIIKDIYLPVISSYLFSSIGAALGLTLKAVIAGEVLGQPKYSIGGSMQLEKMYLNTSGVFAWIIIVVLISVIVEGSIKLLFFRVNRTGFKSKI